MAGRYFSTGKLASLCRMTKHTILNSIERGELAASTTPGGHHRIHETDALLFMRRHNIPTGAVEQHRPRILLVGSDPATAEYVTEGLGSGLAVETAASPFETGVMSERLRPHLIILSLTLPLSADSVDLVRQIVRSQAGRGCRMLALVQAGPPESRRALAEEGIHEVLTRPFTVSELRERVQRIVGHADSRAAFHA